MIEDVGPLGEHGRERLGPAAEIRNEDLDPHVRQPPAEGPDGLDELAGPAVSEVVAGHGRDDGVGQLERGRGFRDALRLVRIGRLWRALIDRAERAGAGTDRAEDEERRRPAGPAFGDVRALGAPADRVQTPLLDERGDRKIVGVRRKTDLQPGRLGGLEGILRRLDDQ